MIYDDILNELEISDLKGDMYELAEYCGIEVAKKLIDFTGGGILSVPALRSVSKLRKRLATTDKYNIRDLAKVFGGFREIKAIKKKQARMDISQSMF